MSTVEGILVIDKPAGWTSHDVCQFIRRRFKIKKVGHTGTLDPQATGVLVLLLGRYTKRAKDLAASDKEYEAVIELGKSTTTQDGEGEVIEEKAIDAIREEEIHKVVASFCGVQEQLPPMVSALKQNGVRLYTLARKGKTVERKPREITIYDIVCTKIDLPLVHVVLSCSKGTYVRTIAHDIGVRLGTGAYLKELVRTRNGKYRSEDAIGIDILKKMEDKEEIAKFVRVE